MRTAGRILLFSLIFCLALYASTEEARAHHPYDSFNHANLIDNTVFRDTSTMNANSIQSFLNARNGHIAGYVHNQPGHADHGRTAAQIIHKYAQEYGINPQVIIATLQKEQSLITATNPVASQYNSAMGYACPTSTWGSCDPKYSGFANQIINGTWQLRFNYERANGNNSWWNPSTSYVCTVPPTKEYYTASLISGNTVGFRNSTSNSPYRTIKIANAATASLYCYTPHAYSQHWNGSHNFVVSFNNWFGSTTVSATLFKGSSSAAVYIGVDGYKIAISSMGLLQDYGYDPKSIRTLDQGLVDSIPYPTEESGLSSSLGYLVRSPSNSTVYLISLGKKYSVQSMAQLSQYGFTTSDITYLPSSYINKLPGNSALTNFIQIPSQLVFSVNEGQKRAIFDAATYNQVNATGAYTPVSSNTAGLVTSGKPLSNREILIKRNGSSAVYLLKDESYYLVPNMETYGCWGFNNSPITPLYTPPSNSYIATPNPVGTLSCIVQQENGATLLLDGTKKYRIPTTHGDYSPLPISQALAEVVAKVPGDSQLEQYVKVAGSDTIWWLEDGYKRPIPSMSNFRLLGGSTSNLVTLRRLALESVPSSGIKLGHGQVVKSSSGAAIFVINNNERIAFTSEHDFLAFGYKWSMVEPYSSTSLNEGYPYGGKTIDRYFYNEATDKSYLLDSNGCYALNDSLLQSYGKTAEAISAAQSYDASTFPNLKLDQCAAGSEYAKEPVNSAVYWINEGKTHRISSWSTLLEHNNGSRPPIVNLSKSTLNNLDVGPEL